MVRIIINICSILLFIVLLFFAIIYPKEKFIYKYADRVKIQFVDSGKTKIDTTYVKQTKYIPVEREILKYVINDTCIEKPVVIKSDTFYILKDLPPMIKEMYKTDTLKFEKNWYETVPEYSSYILNLYLMYKQLEGK